MLIVVMVIVFVLAGLSTSLLMASRTRADRTEADKEDVKSVEAAEAGLDAAIANLNAGGTGCLGIGWYSTNNPADADYATLSEGKEGVDVNGDGFPNSAEVAAGGWYVTDKDGGGRDNVAYSADGYTPPPSKEQEDQPWARPQPAEFDFYTHAKTFGDVRYYTYAVPWGSDGIDNDGANGVDDEEEEGWYTIYSTGFSSEYLSRFSVDANSPLGKFTTVEVIVEQLEAEFEVKAALDFIVAPFVPAP